MSPLKAIIIEDEAPAYELLRDILADYAVGVELCGAVGQVEQARQLIRTSQPDLVFMDVELEGGTAFDVLEGVDVSDFKLIFTTGYDQYALRAFDYEAVDYILKPYSPKQVLRAIERVRRGQVRAEVLQRLAGQMSGRGQGDDDRLHISTREGVLYLRVKDIVRVQADRAYCHIHMVDGSRHIVSKPLKKVSEELKQYNFKRTHKSHLVNNAHVERYSSVDGGVLVMSTGAEVPAG